VQWAVANIISAQSRILDFFMREASVEIAYLMELDHAHLSNRRLIHDDTSRARFSTVSTTASDIPSKLVFLADRPESSSMEEGEYPTGVFFSKPSIYYSMEVTSIEFQASLCSDPWL
jgi:hypothetical protein